MRTARLLLLFLALSLEMNAQVNHKLPKGIFANSEAKSNIELKQDIQFFNPIHFLVEPQFGGLFDSSFKHVKGISNFKKFYDNSNLGFSLGIGQKLTEHLNLKTVYNVGVIKFVNTDFLRAKGYTLKVSINYVF